MATIPIDAALREALGELVRKTWIAWAKKQPNPKPSWLVPWNKLGEPDREVDRQIGEALYREGIESILEPTPELKGTYPLVLYFGVDVERDEMVALLREANPNFVAHKL